LTSATTLAHQFRRGFVLVAQDDDFVAQNLRVFGGRHFSHHLINHVLLGPCHPKHPALTREEWDSAGAHCVSTSQWFMPDSEHGRWHILAATPAWEEWPKHGRRGEFLSEPEYQELLAQTKDRIELLRKEDDIAHLACIIESRHRTYPLYRAKRRLPAR